MAKAKLLKRNRKGQFLPQTTKGKTHKKRKRSRRRRKRSKKSKGSRCGNGTMFQFIKCQKSKKSRRRRQK